MTKMSCCERCGKIFRDQYNLSTHQARIRPCRKQQNPQNDPETARNSAFPPRDSTFEPKNSTFPPRNSTLVPRNSTFENKLKCEFCMTVFSSSWYKKKHEDICRHKNETRVLELDLGITPELPECKTECRFCNKIICRTDALNKHVRVCKERVEYHERLLKQQTQQQMVIQTQQNIQQQHNGNNIQTQNNNTIINNYFPENTIPFGSPRITDDVSVEKAIDLLRMAVYKRYMPDQTYEMAGDIIVELEKLILEIPENRNYIMDEKSSTCMVKTDTGFEYTTKDECTNGIIIENAGLLYSMKGAIKEANPKVFNNNSVVQVFEHQKCFEKRGSNYTPDGLKKVNKIKKRLQIPHKNVVVDF